MEALNNRAAGIRPGSRARRLVFAGAVAAACLVAGGAGGYLVHGSNTAVSVIGTTAAPVAPVTNGSHISPDALDQASTTPVTAGTSGSHTSPDTLDQASTAPSGSHASPDTLDHTSGR